jgi:hypothetical protein
VDAVAGPSPVNLVADLYVTWPDAPADDDALAESR